MVYHYKNDKNISLIDSYIILILYIISRKKNESRFRELLRIVPCLATFCFINQNQMTENSDSLSKAPKSPYKQVDEIAQKCKITVSFFNLFCEQRIKYTCMKADPMALQKIGSIYCSIILIITIEISSKCLQKIVLTTNILY